MLAYPVKLVRDKDGSVLVTSPDFSELTTFGEDEDDALLHAVDAFEEAIAARINRREEIPWPSRGARLVPLSSQIAVKTLLYQVMREKGVRKAELARRLHWHGPQVDRLFDVRHASRLDQIDAAFNVLNMRLNLKVEERAV